MIELTKGHESFIGIFGSPTTGVTYCGNGLCMLSRWTFGGREMQEPFEEKRRKMVI